jgi:hypothetical protein
LNGLIIHLRGPMQKKDSPKGQSSQKWTKNKLRCSEAAV